MKEDRNANTQLEYAISAVKDAEIRDSDAFAEWIKDESNKKLFLEVLDYKEALMNLRDSSNLDTEKSWVHLSSRLSASKASTTPITQTVSYRKIVLYVSSAVAILAFAAWMIASFIPHQKEVIQRGKEYAVIYPAVNNPQNVVLKTSNGQSIVVGDIHNQNKIAQAGAQANSNELNYQDISQAEGEETHTLVIPRGKQFKVVLDDGTEVLLNTESSLRYPVRFSGKERVVELSGEAFFKVAKDTSHPFVVKSGNTEVRVLGTQFDFCNYSQERRHITLVSGSLKVKETTANNQIVLRPGEDVILGQSKLVSKQANIEETTAWMSGLFYFENSELGDIMKVLGRWYNLTVKFIDVESMHYHFSFWSNRNDSPKEVVDRLNKVGKVNAKYDVSTQTIIIQH